MMIYAVHGQNDIGAEECDFKFSTCTNYYYYRVNKRSVVVIVRFTLYNISLPAILFYYYYYYYYFSTC